MIVFRKCIVLKRVYYSPTIVTVKQAMAEDRANARSRREKKARLQELLAQKQDEALSTKSAEELQKLIDDLGD